MAAMVSLTLYLFFDKRDLTSSVDNGNSRALLTAVTNGPIAAGSRTAPSLVEEVLFRKVLDFDDELATDVAPELAFARLEARIGSSSAAVSVEAALLRKSRAIMCNIRTTKRLM